MGRQNEKLGKKVAKLGLNRVRRHIFLCNDTKKCNCASESQMKASWKHLKKRLREIGEPARSGIMYSRTHCMDICTGGPVAVVYPEGTWYGGCDEKALEEIIQRHLLEGKIVPRYVIADPEKRT